MSSIERRPIDAVVFDKDGVLADSEWINLESAMRVFAAHGRPLDTTAANEIIGKHPSDYLPRIARRLGIDAPHAQRMLEEKERLYAEMWAEEGRLVEGAREVLSTVRALGLPLGIATSSTRGELLAFLHRFELAEHFDVVLSRDDVACPKPDPEIYLNAFRMLGTSGRGTMVVEDSIYGTRSARAAGAFCVGIPSDHVTLADLQAADAIITSLDELPALLVELGGGCS